MNRETEMRALFARWKSSGQSLAAFGKAEGFSYSKLLYWRKKLGEGSRSSDPQSSPRPAQLIPIQVKPDSAPPDPASKFEVWFPDGTALDVPSGFNEIDLRRLISALRPC